MEHPLTDTKISTYYKHSNANKQHNINQLADLSWPELRDGAEVESIAQRDKLFVPKPVLKAVPHGFKSMSSCELIHATHLHPPDIQDIYHESRFRNPNSISLIFLPKNALLMKVMRAAAITASLKEAGEVEIDDKIWWIRAFNYVEFHQFV